VADLVCQPQPKFELIKKHYPQVKGWVGWGGGVQTVGGAGPAELLSRQHKQHGSSMGAGAPGSIHPSRPPTTTPAGLSSFAPLQAPTSPNHAPLVADPAGVLLLEQPGGLLAGGGVHGALASRV
jgi:hypothetical protein